MSGFNNTVIKNKVLDLMEITADTVRIPHDPKRDRFDLSYSHATRVHDDLNANRIVIDNKNIAIATQYPFDHQIEDHLEMMVENLTPVLVILASNHDIQKNKLPEYFSRSERYGLIKTNSVPVKRVELGEKIEAYVFKMEVNGVKESIDIPVIHVHNWPDFQTVSPGVTKKLVELIETTSAEKKDFYKNEKHEAMSDPEKVLPVIHCKAGVGRTGQAIAAMAMKRNPELSLESIIKDLRLSRNNTMVQAPKQMETLLMLKTNTRR